MTFEELLTGQYVDTLLEYTGSIFGDCEDMWMASGHAIYDTLFQMFGEDINDSIVLEDHPVYTGKKGFYIQNGDIWNNQDGEQCVFRVLVFGDEWSD